MNSVFRPVKHPGKLHRELGIPTDQPIPKARLKAAEHSSNREVRDDAIRADTMEHWHHGGRAASVVPRHHPSSAYRK